MWKMLQQKPRDFVIGSGKVNTVKDFLSLALKELILIIKSMSKLIKDYSEI